MQTKLYNVAIIGASGAVGEEIIAELEDINFPINELILFGSSNSAGQSQTAFGKDLTIQELNENSFKIKLNGQFRLHSSSQIGSSHIDIAFFAAGGDVSARFVPLAVEQDILVIDNTSFFRMDQNVPLIVPEVNIHELKKIKTGKKLIANPNCSTIQMVQVLNPLHKINPIKRVDVSTYQAVSGAGKGGMEELVMQMQAFFNFSLSEVEPRVFPHRIALNLIPHIDKFMPSSFTKEELKMINETHKIMDASFPIAATCVRVPILRSHSESISITFENEFSAEDAKKALASAPNIKLIDNIENLEYPMPSLASETNFTYVGRVRNDLFDSKILHLFCVADQIKVGAATNAVRIAKAFIEL
ncbi:MAG: aspartate-semialdehyde dehydrogenase [Helicobacter sp.]|nr:aspartate-semialdehyde dehydrogenase [Helicobacter sp.]